MRHNKQFLLSAFVGIFLTISFVTLISCQTTMNRYLGKAVPEHNRVLLPEGKPLSGIYQTRDLVLQYTFDRESNQLKLSGELALEKSYDQFEIIHYVNLWVHFLDSEGNVIDSKLTWRVISQIDYTDNQVKKWPVTGSVELPQNTTAIALSYRGSAQQGAGKDNSSMWIFYKSPLT